MELREAALASMKVASGDLAELHKHEEALTLEAAERAREYECVTSLVLVCSRLALHVCIMFNF